MSEEALRDAGRRRDGVDREVLVRMRREEADAQVEQLNAALVEAQPHAVHS
jgi:hypothetical protein